MLSLGYPPHRASRLGTGHAVAPRAPNASSRPGFGTGAPLRVSPAAGYDPAMTAANGPARARPRPLVLPFTLRGRVGRRAYALVGFGLMALKYGVDALAIRLATGALWTPFDYLAPFWAVRQAKLAGAPVWLDLALALWTLPFLWIGVSMSVRRAWDAGHSPWAGLLFLVPLANYPFMLYLACAPSAPARGELAAAAAEELALDAEPYDARLRSALVAVAVAVALALALVAFSIYVARGYGTALFLGTPVLLGAVAGFVHNRAHARPFGDTLVVAGASVLIAGGALLLFAAEGLLCLVMAAPIAFGPALLGAIVGRAIALLGETRALPSIGGAAILALVGGWEGAARAPASYETVTAVEIDAPPETVWEHVVSFSELPPPAGLSELPFRLGIAYPLRARIEGRGVGAVRHCEFSTGPFVEPITTWDPPRRLSFDVVAQPDAMHEWSPYRDVHPPHLDGFIRSTRGEFRLVALPGGRTRLEGSTWYELAIFPAPYWRLWSDLLVHRIHTRVLEHVRDLAESA